MKKISLIIIGMFLLAFVIAGVSIGTTINKDIELTKAEKDTLEEINIINPVVSNCLKMSDSECEFNIYQEKGINKDIIIKTKECLEWKIVEDTPTQILPSVCIKWKVLSKEEIETRMQEKTKEILQNIVVIKDQRDNKVDEFLTDEINITIKEKK